MQVNLRKLYPYIYKADEFVEISQEIFEALRAFERAEAAWQRKKYRYKAHYSLDYGNGIKKASLVWPKTPEQIMEEKRQKAQMLKSLMSLTDKQRRRICARYFLEMKTADIARVERADLSRIYASIRSGLRRLGKDKGLAETANYRR